MKKLSFKNFIAKGIIISMLTLIISVMPLHAKEISTLSMQYISKPIVAELKYEAKEKTSLENPVIDPNFNVMRNNEIGKSKAIPLVVGILIIAIIAPIATWYYFNN